MIERIGSNEFRVGLSFECCKSIYTTQSMSNWCWAASTEMVLKKHSILGLNQEKIVNHLNSNSNDFNYCFPNCPNDFETVAKILNIKQIRNKFNKFKNISANTYFGKPSDNFVINNLLLEEPIIISHNLYNYSIGHAVVVTNVEFIQRTNQSNQITKIYFLDPFQNSNVQNNIVFKIFDAAYITQFITGFFVIKVEDVKFYPEFP